MSDNPYQSCQNCTQWHPPKRGATPPLGFCRLLQSWRHHESGKECGDYDPLLDGEEVVRRSQLMMEAERNAAS